jgi:signal transduction histidine kinase
VDPEQVRSVLHNLVLNAIEAIPGEGTILVETFQENGTALLAVSDTGKGMTQDFLHRRLFRPFQTTKPRGLGIGLYQCRHIVQRFGGTLTAESQEGEGTRMLVRLPCDGSRVQPSGINPSACAQGRALPADRPVRNETVEQPNALHQENQP